MNGNDHEEVDEDDEDGIGEDSIAESASMGLTGGSDEMLMSLLAGQAALDCEGMPMGGWEEVESWKKVRSTLTIG